MGSQELDLSVVDTLEAILFVSEAPVPMRVLTEVTGYREGQITQALEVLSEKLLARSPLQLVEIAGGFQLCTRPEFAEVIGRFLKPRAGRLSRSLLEVLAIVAYRQPVTIAEIDEVRGVQSDYGVRALLERRLIREVGRKATPGRPILYGTTPNFLHQFNLRDLSQLPPVDAPPVIQPALPIGGEE